MNILAQKAGSMRLSTIPEPREITIDIENIAAKVFQPNSLVIRNDTGRQGIERDIIDVAIVASRGPNGKLSNTIGAAYRWTTVTATAASDCPVTPKNLTLIGSSLASQDNTSVFSSILTPIPVIRRIGSTSLKNPSKRIQTLAPTLLADGICTGGTSSINS